MIVILDLVQNAIIEYLDMVSNHRYFDGFDFAVIGARDG